MIRYILYPIMFWTIFVLYITILYPVVYFASQKFTTRYVYRVCTKYLLWCFRQIGHINYKLQNEEYLQYIKDNTPVIIGCNHQSAWETFIFSLYFDELSIVIKKELLDIPIAGLYFKRLGCIPIDRSKPIIAIKSLLKSSEIAIEQHQNILIFPNGTRSIDDEHTEYKSGVYAMYKHLNVPVVPVHVNSRKYCSKGLFIKLPGTITLELKKPITPGLDKKEFMGVFEERMKS